MPQPIKCNACSSEWYVDDSPLQPCPNCGGNRLQVSFSEVNAPLSDSVKYVGKENGKTVIEGHAEKSATRAGPNAGKDAWVEQMIDKTFKPGRYKKKVTEADNTISKSVDGPVTDQSLHGRQMK